MKNQENFDFRRKGTSTDVTDEMSQMLEGSDGDSSCCYTNMPASNCEHSGNKWKNRKPQRSSRRYKEEPGLNFELKK